MDVLRRIEGYFASLQLEGLFVVRCEPERSFQHVNGLIAGVRMPGGHPAGGNITDKHHDFFSLHAAHRLAQQFSPRNLGWCSLCADIRGPACSDRYAEQTDTKKHEQLVHSALPCTPRNLSG